MKKKLNYYLIMLIIIVALLVGCVSTSNNELQSRVNPLEEFNQVMFNFNYNILDPYILRPVAVAWRNYLPVPARNGLNNFTSNLEEPASMVNTLLRGHPYRAMIHFNRFFLNTLLGMGGMIDVAKIANPILAREESSRFGGTLGYYNMGYGPYVILPGYGSFTLREDGGNLVDTLYPMLSYLTFWISSCKWVLEGIETRAKLLDSDSLFLNSSNPYIMVREAYFQYHDFIANNESPILDKNLNAKAIYADLAEIDSIASIQ